MDHIIFSNGHFTVCLDGTRIDSACKAISHYKSVIEQLRVARDWKSGTEHVFGDSYMIPMDDSYFEPSINGLSSISGDYFYYSLELDKGGGIYKKSKNNPDDEGFVFTSVEIVPQHLHADGSRLACSMKYSDGTSHIAMFLSERPDYIEFTGGESVDEHPFIYNGMIFFDSAGIRRDQNGNFFIGNRGISVYDIKSNSIIELFYSEDNEFLLPKVANNGDLYCIKRPAQKESSRCNSLISVITAPFWIFAALIGFISVFVRIFSGKQLLGKSKQESVKASAKEIIDGCDIDIEREEKRNTKRGEQYPGYAPHNWELIKIEKGAFITDRDSAKDALKNAVCVHRGVIGYDINDELNAITISNGNCLFCKYNNGRIDLITKSRSINRNFTVVNI